MQTHIRRNTVHSRASEMLRERVPKTQQRLPDKSENSDVSISVIGPLDFLRFRKFAIFENSKKTFSIQGKSFSPRSSNSLESDSVSMAIRHGVGAG